VATKLVNYRLPTELVTAVAQESERSGVTRTEIVREAVEARLNGSSPEQSASARRPSDREMAERLREALRRRGPNTERLARQEEARRLGISDAEARRLLG
jgi:hypothetical protein